MQPTTTKADVLARVRQAYAVLDATIAGLGDDRMTEPGVGTAWSVKDNLAHLTWWQDRMLRRLGGEDVPFELPGEDYETTIQRINEEEFRQHRGLPAAEIKAAYFASCQRTLAALLDASDELLLAHREEIEADTWGHFAEHSANIQSMLK